MATPANVPMAMPVAQMMGLLMAEPVATVVADAQPMHGSGSELALKEMVDFLQQQLRLSDKFNAKQIVDAACEQLGVPAGLGNLMERARAAYSLVTGKYSS